MGWRPIDAIGVWREQIEVVAASPVGREWSIFYRQRVDLYRGIRYPGRRGATQVNLPYPLAARWYLPISLPSAKIRPSIALSTSARVTEEPSLSLELSA